MHRITLLTNPDKCNLRCALCFLRQNGIVSFSGEMPFETAKAAIEKYAAEKDSSGNSLLKEVIPSTMGEPLLYSRFENLLHLCEMSGIKMNLTTNGTFPGKWSSPSLMFELVQACSDIKVSTLAYEMGGFLRHLWRENVEKLIECRKRRLDSSARISLQVALHRENLQDLQDIVTWAEQAGVQRIKWNPAVFMPNSAILERRFKLNKQELDTIRQELLKGSLHSDKIKYEGSLFLDDPTEDCPMSGSCEKCPFTDEVWIWPDGHEDHCPNPKKRWGKF
ncbi:Radical SAM superfamily enzyme, MoaA/NifB/PqqE/SkfB family [Fibrobacter sp. UWB10]|nr:radical SAM protein [Fibrobacter sp. UWB10]SMP37590.1 Radical SAM superfamily enzyme, MoaA/NifB/PqqE/SkfB family [Fibrobacter sp. UWB10]